MQMGNNSLSITQLYICRLTKFKKLSFAFLGEEPERSKENILSFVHCTYSLIHKNLKILKYFNKNFFFIKIKTVR